MTDTVDARREPAFSPRTVLALVAVGIVAFAGLAVLSAYAPDLRGGEDGGPHALSRSAVGYAGAAILVKAMGGGALVSRTPSGARGGVVVVLTPTGDEDPTALESFVRADRVLVVLPKWMAVPDPKRRGFVRKAGVTPAPSRFSRSLGAWAPATRVAVRSGAATPVLRGAGAFWPAGVELRPGGVDRLQTLSGDGWIPVLTDETGAMVLAQSRKEPKVLVLAEPDLLNNHGLADPATARAGMEILRVLAGGDRAIVFDVTLNGFERGRGLWRTMLEPPWLAATLIAVAAAGLMGLHALARFGQPRRGDRPLALGAGALVESSAALVRTARREAEFAPAYAILIREQVARAAGEHADDAWLAELAGRRGLDTPAALAAQARRAKTRDDALAVARKLHDWREEMTRERR